MARLVAAACLAVMNLTKLNAANVVLRVRMTAGSTGLSRDIPFHVVTSGQSVLFVVGGCTICPTAELEGGRLRQLGARIFCSAVALSEHGGVKLA